MNNLQQRHTQWAKNKSISLKIRNKTGMSTFTTLNQHSTGRPSTAIRQKEEITGIQIGKEKQKCYSLQMV